MQCGLENILIKSRYYFAVILPLAAPQLLKRTPIEPSQQRYAGHRPLRDRLMTLQCEGFIKANADVDCVALLIQGAAIRAALTEITQGANALGSNPSQWVSRIAASVLG